jgi:hypothetical protein
MKIFYIRSIQKSEKQNNTIIIQGHCNERMMEGAKIKAFIDVTGCVVYKDGA